MITSSLHQRMPGLLIGCSFIVSYFLLSACEVPSSQVDSGALPKPAFVITVPIANLPPNVFPIDLNRIKKGADYVFLNEIVLNVEKARYWQVNVRRLFGDQTRLDGIEFTDEKTKPVVLKNLPLDTMLTVDVDLIFKGSPKSDDVELKTLRYILLLHNPASESQETVKPAGKAKG